MSFRKGKRDGTPVPVLLRNQREVAVAIEDNADGDFKPYIIKNTLMQNWQDAVKGDGADRHYTLRQKIAAEV